MNIEHVNIKKVMQPFNRTQFVAQLIPQWIGPGVGLWLDAGNPGTCKNYAPIAEQKNYKLTSCSLHVNEDSVKHTDLQKYDPNLGVYDLVTCTCTLDHIDDYHAALRNLKKYCKHYMILEVPRGGNKDGHARQDPTVNDQHFWSFNSDQLRVDIERAGWRVCNELVNHQFLINCVGHVYFCTLDGQVEKK